MMFSPKEQLMFCQLCQLRNVFDIDISVHLIRVDIGHAEVSARSSNGSVGHARVAGSTCILSTGHNLKSALAVVQ